MLLSHAGPDVRVDRIGAVYGFVWIVADLDPGPGMALEGLGFLHDLRLGLERWRRGDVNRDSELGAGDHKGVAHIVTIADVSQLQAPEAPELLLQCEEVSERLAGVKEITQPIDHRNRSVLCQLDNRSMGKGPRHNAVYPALEVAGDVFDGFAVTETLG